MKNGAVVDRHAVAVGQKDWQTATGVYKLRKKLVNPPWKPTKEMVEREGIKDDEVPPGPENPLGDRWMGWSKPGFGFHSTTAPATVGQAASHGCVRLYPEAAHRMFDQVSVGMPILALYEPVVVGRRGDDYYLTVYPDIYDKGLVTLTQVEKRLEALGRRRPSRAPRAA